MPGYVYAHKDNRVYVNLFVSGQADIALNETNTVRLTQTTAMPWAGDVRLTVNSSGYGAFQMAIRIPGWTQNQPVPGDLYSYVGGSVSDIEIKVNGSPVAYTTEQGYAVIDRTWQAGDVVTLDFPMQVHRVVTSDLVGENRGKVALERGPIVYCLEWCDNDGRVLSSVVSDDAAVTVEDDSQTFEGMAVKTLKIQGQRMAYDEHDQKTAETITLTAIPYYAWDNRGIDGEMAVWLARTEDAATVIREKVAHTDTIDYHLGQVATSQAYTSDYPAVSFPVDRMRVVGSLGVNEGQLSSLLGSYITFAAIEPNGNVNESSTAVAPGQWFNSVGKVVTWCDPSATTNTEDQSIIFAEYKKATTTFLIGQFPQLCHEGDEYTWQQALTYVPQKGSPARVVFRFHLHVTDARTAYGYALAHAQSLLDSPLYAYVTGGERTALETAVSQNPTTDTAYKTAATQLYAAATTFVNVRQEQDVTSQYITNPSFESGTTGWTITLSGTGGQNINTEQGHASDGNSYSGFWRAGLATADYHQQVTLPTGKYRMSVDLEYNFGNASDCWWQSAQPYFGTHKSEPAGFDVTMLGKGVWQTFDYEFSLDEETTADFGVLLTPAAGGTWGHIDNFRLVRTGDADITAVESIGHYDATPLAKTYDLSGRQIGYGSRPGTLQKGIIIMDGRKIMK